MPELPEVETVRRGLAPAMEGGRIERLELRRPDLRFPLPERFAERVEGKIICALGRRAKYLLVDLEDDQTIIMHLGMSGSFRIDGDVPGDFHHERSRIEAHDHVVFHMQGAKGANRIVYNDPRRFGFMLLDHRATLDENAHFAKLGVEPTGNALDASYLAGKFAGKLSPLKAALLDQHIIAGLGNIYVCEALWRAGLSPRRRAATLVHADGRPTTRLDVLVDHIRDVIAEAIEAGGSSLRDHARTDGTMGYFQHRFSAYDREGAPCAKPDCTGTVRRIVQSSRSTFFCPACQR